MKKLMIAMIVLLYLLSGAAIAVAQTHNGKDGPGNNDDHSGDSSDADHHNGDSTDAGHHNGDSSDTDHHSGHHGDYSGDGHGYGKGDDSGDGHRHHRDRGDNSGGSDDSPTSPAPITTPAPTNDPPADPAPVSNGDTGSISSSRQNGFGGWSFGTCDCDRIRILQKLQSMPQEPENSKRLQYMIDTISWESQKTDVDGMVSYCKLKGFNMSFPESYYDWKPD